MRYPSRTAAAAIFGVSFAIVTGLQLYANAYGSEWSHNPDEPAHFVTGLMVHDYVVQGFPANPMKFAQEFYRHYPKVALGHWPPMFYVVEASWMLLFGASRVSLLLLMAAIAAVLLSGTYHVLRRYYPSWMAAGGVLLAATSPVFQQFSNAIMTDLLVTLLVLLSLFTLKSHLERTSWASGVWFGFLAMCAIMTKGTGIALAPLPLASALLLGRRKILAAWPFWSPVIVVALCIPWYFLAPDALHTGVTFLRGPLVPWNRLKEAILFWISAFNPVCAILLALGIGRCVALRWRGSEIDSLRLLMLLLFPSVLTLRAIIGDWTLSYMVIALPAVIFLICTGAAWLLEVVKNRRLGYFAATVLLVASVGWNLHRLVPKVHLGLDLVAREIAGNPAFADATLLIVSDAQGEGVFIAEIASRERRPGHVVQRGTKVLSSSTWAGRYYRSFFDTPQELLQHFERNPGPIVLVLDSPDVVMPHLAMAAQTVEAYQERWQLAGAFERRHPNSNLRTNIRVLRFLP